MGVRQGELEDKEDKEEVTFKSRWMTFLSCMKDKPEAMSAACEQRVISGTTKLVASRSLIMSLRVQLYLVIKSLNFP
jgi:hypothetical protein